MTRVKSMVVKKTRLCKVPEATQMEEAHKTKINKRHLFALFSIGRLQTRAATSTVTTKLFIILLFLMAVNRIKIWCSNVKYMYLNILVNTTFALFFKITLCF